MQIVKRHQHQEATISQKAYKIRMNKAETDLAIKKLGDQEFLTSNQRNGNEIDPLNSQKKLIECKKVWDLMMGAYQLDMKWISSNPKNTKDTPKKTR